MSALYGSMTTDASRGGGCTRRGNKAMSCHLRGWDEGIRVEMRLDHNGKVEWSVYRTKGSNANGPAELIAEGIEGCNVLRVEALGHVGPCRNAGAEADLINDRAHEQSKGA